MGSIPLPALHVNPPEQQPNALEQYARMVQLKQQQALMPGQLEQQQQTIQAGQQENQLRGQQIKDQQAMTQAYRQWDGKDPNDLAKLVSDAGGSANARTTIEQHYLGLKKQYSDIAKNDADTGAKNLDILKQKNDNTLGAITAAESVPDEQLGAHLAQAVQQLTQQQMLDPQHAQQGAALVQALQSGQVTPQQARQTLDVFKKTLQSNSQMQAQAKDQAETAKNNAQAGMDTANTAKIQAELNFYKKQGLAPGVPLDAQEAASWLQQNPGKTPADFMKYKSTLVPAFNFNLQAGGAGATAAPKAPDGTPLTGEDLYKSFGAKGPMVKSIVEGRQTMPAGFALKSPYWQDVMNKVYQADPQFSEQRAQIRKTLTTGKAGDNIGSLNTATVHLDALGEAAKALDNGSFTPGNAAYNAVSRIFGAKAPTDFAGFKAAVAGEMANAMKGNATDIEIKTIGTALDAASSPKQLAGVVDDFLHLNYQKLNTYKERLEQQIPGDTAYSPVLPSAAKVFAKHGISDQSQPIGSYTPPAGAKTAVGPNGHKIVVDGGKWVDAETGKPIQ